MAAETLSCPYCNSSVTLLRPASAGQRLRCPRCHELFPYRGGAEGTQAADDAQLFDPAGTMEDFGESDRRPRRRSWSNRAVALVILSIMLAMAAIGFTFAWFTTKSRRERDFQRETSTQVVSVTPARLAALGYLPDSTNAIAAVHIAELMAQPETASLLRLIRSDRVNFGIYRLEELTGLRLEDLDHFVIGLQTEEADFPHIYVVVQTRFPYDEEGIAEKLNAKRANVPGKRIYRIPPGQIPLGCALWCAGPHTLVFSLQPKDLASLPAEPVPGVVGFPGEVQKYLTAPGMEQGTLAWAVGAASTWDQILHTLQLVGLTEEDQRALSQVRTFSGQLHFSGKANSNVDGLLEAECADAAGARAFANFLAAKGVDPRRLGALAQQRTQAATLFEELARSLRRQQNARHVLVQFNATTESIRQALEIANRQSRTAE